MGISGTTINTEKYDPNGLGTLINISNNKYVAHRIWYAPDENRLFFQYGQEQYANEAEALYGFTLEDYIVPPALPPITYLVSVVILQEGETDLDNATFVAQGKFAGSGGGGSGSVDTLQTAYNNSSNPEILTDSSRGSIDFRQGSGSDIDKVLTIQNGSGVDTGYFLGNGYSYLTNLSATTVSANTFYGNLNWNYITNTPTTLAGYGITDAYTITEVNNNFLSAITSINQLSDVNTSGVTQGQYLSYSAGTWVPVDDSTDLSNYYNKQESNAKFVFVTGDTMTGDLNLPNINVSSNLTVTGTSLFYDTITYSGDARKYKSIYKTAYDMYSNGSTYNGTVCTAAGTALISDMYIVKSFDDVIEESAICTMNIPTDYED
jgi:hypothetical protein